MLSKSLFAQTMTMLFELYEKQQTKPLMDIYYSVLYEMDDDSFRSAVMQLMKTRVYPSMPKPAEILEFSPKEVVVMEDDHDTKKAKELIKGVETINTIMWNEAQKRGLIFDELIRTWEFTNITGETMAILNNVKPYCDHRQLIINIRRYQNSSEAIRAFKNAIIQNDRIGAIESDRVQKMIKAKQ